jgi:DNA-binding transcriptional ArsR family regulator
MRPSQRSAAIPLGPLPVASEHGIINNLMVVDDLTDTEVDRLFHALADATRRDIVRHAVEGAQSVSALARRYPISLTAVQKHVSVLEQAGLVVKERHGREQRVVGQHDALRQARLLLDELEQLWRGRVARMGELLDEDSRGETT